MSKPAPMSLAAAKAKAAAAKAGKAAPASPAAIAAKPAGAKAAAPAAAPVRAVAKSPPPLLDEDRDKLDLLEIVVLLSDLLAQENALLEAYQIAEVQNLAQRKVMLARLYEQHMQAAAANPLVIEEMEPERRARLKEAAIELDRAGRENHRLLTVRIETGNRVLKGVVDAVKKHQSNNGLHYEANGTLAEPSKAVAKVAISINNVF